MQIEITDEQIEAVLKQVIRERIKEYLADKNIEALVAQEVQHQTKLAFNELDQEFILNLAKENMADNLKDALCSQITSDIVTALCDKYY